MFALLVSIVLIISTAMYYYRVKMGKIRKSLLQFPGPPGLPILGNFLQMGKNSIENMQIFEQMWHKYGNSFRVFIGPFASMLFLTDPRDVEILLSSNRLITKPAVYSYLSPWLGKGLVINTGDPWRRNRKIITPTFHFKILEQFLPTFHSQLDVLVDKLSQAIKKSDAVVDVCPFITAFGLDVICETAMGQHVDAQNNTEGEYVRAVKSMLNVANRRIMNPFLRNNTVFRCSRLYKQQAEALVVLHEFVDRVIENRKKELVSQPEDSHGEVDDIGLKKRFAFLDLLLKCKDDQGNPLPYSMIRDEVHTFMFAGHDTTTIAISFACYLFSLHPEIQQKAFQEQRDILGDDLTRQPTNGEIQEMKYLEMVVKEVMRLYPPAPFFPRQITEDTDFRGKTVVAGCVVMIAPFLIHKNPEQFPDPEKFDPERFSAEQQSKRHPFSYIPFSAGPRNCLGQKFAHLELRATVSRLLRHFEFLPSGLNREIILSAEFTMRIWSGIHLKMKKREYSL